MRPRFRWRSGAALAALVATACPAAERPPGAFPTAAPAGRITVAYPFEPATLDPFTTAGDSVATRDLVRLVMPSTYFGGDGERGEPWILASEPVVSRRGRVVRMTVRPDARWSDGRPIGARDLRFTWRVARRRHFGRGFGSVTRVVVESVTTARFVFRRGLVDPWNLYSNGLGVLPAHALRGRLGRLRRGWPVSGGPYVLRRWRAGLDMTFEPNPHACCGMRPAIAGIRVVFVPDATAALELFRRGRVDVLGPYHAVEWTRRAGEVPGARLATAAGHSHLALMLKVGAPPLDEGAVRGGLMRIVDAARPRLRALAATESEPPDEARGPPPDLDEIDDALADAGWRGRPVRARAGRPLRFALALVGSEDLSWVLSRAIREQAALHGYDIQIAPLPPDRFWREWVRSARYAAALQIRRWPPARWGRGLDQVTLYAARVTLAARGVALCSGAGPDGPFWAAHRWTLGEGAPPC